MFSDTRSWVLAAILILLFSGPFVSACARAEETSDDVALKSRFQSLSQHGNVECSVQFEKLIGTMGPEGRLQGSCCAPMDEARYRQQLEGLKKYADIAEVPHDPYDIPAQLAHRLMGRPEQRRAGCLRLRDAALRYAGAMLLQVLALEGVWWPRQIPHSCASLHRRATHRPVECRPRLRRGHGYEDARLI